MPTFEKELPNVRLAEVRPGDDLRRIALRELGTAALWVDLALLNTLSAPYIVKSEAQRVDSVLVVGDLIKLPASEAYVTADADPDGVFYRDVRLARGQLDVDGGDLALVGGMDNLLQALGIRLSVLKRELSFHPSFGNYAGHLKGRKLGPAEAQLAAFYARSALMEDSRVQSVTRCVATVEGTTLRIQAEVVPISGRPLNFSTVI